MEEPRYNPWPTLAVSIAVSLWLVSLASGGYIYILHFAVEGCRSSPLLLLATSPLGALYAFYKILKSSWAYLSKPKSRNTIIIVGLILPPILSLVSISICSWGVLWIPTIYFLKGYRELGSLEPRKIRLRRGAISNPLLGFVAVGIVVFGVLGMLYSPIQASHAINPVTLDKPVNVYSVYRIIPLYTAYAYASDRIQIPTHTVYREESYLYYQDSKPIYNWLIEPEGFWNQLTRNPVGAVFADGSRYPVNITLVNQEVKWGLHNKRFKLLYIDTLRRHAMLAALGYDIRFDEAMEIYYNNTLWIAIPYNTWTRGLIWSLPVPGGVLLVDKDGNIKNLNPGEALQNPVLRGTPILTEKAARKWAETYAYHKGFTAYYLKHDYYQIRDVGSNPQPYLEPGDNNTLYWVFVVEPAGETYSAKYVIYINARPTTTQPTIMLWKPGKPIIGVSKALSYIKQAHPNYDWSQVQPVEPQPTIINNQTIWKTTIVTRDYRGLVSIDLINATTGQTITITPTTTITPETLLQAITKTTTQPTTGNQTITQQIQEIQEKIQQTINELNQLLQQLEKLKQQINQTK